MCLNHPAIREMGFPLVIAAGYETGLGIKQEGIWHSVGYMAQRRHQRILSCDNRYARLLTNLFAAHSTESQGRAPSLDRPILCPRRGLVDARQSI